MAEATAMGVAVRVPDGGQVFGEFYASYAPRVAGLARRLLVPPSEVDDVVQETLLRAYRAGIHEDDRDAWPWLARVARNVCCDASRTRRRRPVVPSLDSLDVCPAAGADPVDVTVEHRARAGYVAAALRSLPEHQCELLVRHHVDDVSCADIAAAERHSVQAVKSALARARGAFRTTYEGWRGMVPALLGGGAARVRSGLIALGLALGLAVPPGLASEPPSTNEAANEAEPEVTSVSPPVIAERTPRARPLLLSGGRPIGAPPLELAAGSPTPPARSVQPALGVDGGDGPSPPQVSALEHDPPAETLPLDVSVLPSVGPAAASDAATQAVAAVEGLLGSLPDPVLTLPI